MSYNGGVNVIALRTLRTFWLKHSQAEIPLRDWEKRMRKSNFSDFNQLRKAFPSADYLKVKEGELTIFNVAGNSYRLVVSIKYESQIVFIKKVMTHAEYDRWNKTGRYT